MVRKLQGLFALLIIITLSACSFNTPTEEVPEYAPFNTPVPQATVGADVVFRAEWHNSEDLDPQENSVVPGWTYKFYQENELKFQVAEIVAADGTVLGSVSPLAMEGKILGTYSLTDIEGVYLRFPDGSEIHPILPIEGSYINYK